KSDSIFVEMTPPVNISDVINACFDIINAGGITLQKNGACATSISCQKDVNRRIFLCGRIEIRIREVVSDKNDTIIRKVLVLGRM
ncbi:MAG: hypothetical protein ACI4SF_04900, partial [Oscillospiraceae bacterium]